MQNNYPQKAGIDYILKEAFSYWNRTLVFQILFSLVYFSVLFLVLFYFATKFGIFQQYLELSEKLKQGMDAYRQGVAEIAQNPNFMKFQWIVLGTLSFLFPLNLGLFKIFRKLDLAEKPEMEDLFAGYSGYNFFIYFGYFMFWFTIYTYLAPTIFLGILWILITLFTAPLMFFMDKRIIETFGLNYNALKLFPLEIIIGSFIAIAFKYFGIFTLFGAIFTFPFWNAMIYALYRKIFSEVD